MLSIDFKLNGRTVTSNGFKNAIEKAMFAKIRSHVVSRLSAVSCSKHGKYAHVTAEGATLDRLAFSITGCCAELVDRAKAALR